MNNCEPNPGSPLDQGSPVSLWTPKKTDIIVLYQYFTVTSGDEEYRRRRQQEINICLRKTAENRSVNAIHLLVEQEYALEFIPQELRNKIHQVVIHVRLTYQRAFEYYNENLANHICILQNADIYTDESIEVLHHADFRNTVFCLNRYEESDGEPRKLYGVQVDLCNKYKCKYLTPYTPAIWTQDAWVWKAPHIKVPGSDFELGTVGCDNYIAGLLYNAGFRLCNSSHLICINHVDNLSVETTEFGIIKGNISKKREQRVGNMSTYIFLENLDDMPDKYTIGHTTHHNSRLKIILSTTFQRTLHRTDFSDVEQCFDTPLKLCFIDILPGQTASFTIEYFVDEWLSETSVNTVTNVDYIKRIYFDQPVECTKIRITPPLPFRVAGYNSKLIQSELNNGHVMTYYEHSWQKPVVTEYGIYELFCNQQNLPYNYFAFPWAQYIDNKWYRDKSLNQLIADYIEAKPMDISYCTVIQHKDYRDLLPLFRKLGIHVVFAVHFCETDRHLAEEHGMTLLPMSLYPIQNGEGLPMAERKYLTSFIGQYDPKKYISDIRVKIFDLFSKYPDCYIVQRKLWHYQSIVFKNVPETAHPECEKEYKDLLADSRFSLCPSGSGANSIRLWESLSFGSVPILLADTYILPEIKGLDWNDVLIIWKEADIDRLYDHLKSIDMTTLETMSQKGIALYNEYFSTKRFNRFILEYFNL